MRTARLGVVLVAHGSRDPRAAASTESLRAAVAVAHPSWEVHAAYLDHAGPRPLDVLAGLSFRGHGRAVLVPLLLTSAYHGRVDVPAVVTAAREAGLRIDVAVSDVLGAASGPAFGHAAGAASGPACGFSSGAASDAASGLGSGAAFGVGSGPASGAGSGPASGTASGPLTDALVRRLPAADLDAVVLAAAGTRNAAARATVQAAAVALGVRLGLPSAVAYASAAAPMPGEAVAALRAQGAERVGVAAYFLAPGLLYDTAVESAMAAGAVAVAPPLGDAPELVRLVAARVHASAEQVLSVAA